MLNNLEKLIQIYDDPPIDDASSMVRDPKPTKPETDKNKEILKYLTKNRTHRLVQSHSRRFRG